MGIYKKEWGIETKGQGTYEITSAVVDGLQESTLEDGLCNVFVRHTSCSLILMENADPSAMADLQLYMNQLVPENYSGFTHTYEGADDMPSHIKMVLTKTSENIPFSKSSLELGTWQGLFLWEHRTIPHHRKLVFTYLG